REPVARSTSATTDGWLADRPMYATKVPLTRTRALDVSGTSMRAGAPPPGNRHSPSAPLRRTMATISPLGAMPYHDRPKTHSGPANSASMGAIGTTDPPAPSESVQRWRFHQPDRSEMKTS